MKAAGGSDGGGATSFDAPLSMKERQELIELRRKFKQVQQERDILAKGDEEDKMRISANVTGDFGNVTGLEPVLGCARGL